MKRNILFGLAAALCLTGMASAKAASAPTVWLDGEPMTFEVAPVIENDRTMVPYRAIFEKLGYQVGWDADTRSVTAAKGSTTMKLTIGSKSVTVNGGTVTSDTAPVIRQDRTLVPLRLVSEYSGCDVLWDKGTRTVAMYHKQAKNAMSEKLGCVTTDGDSLLVTHSNEVTNEFGTQGYSLTNLSPIALIPRFEIDAVCDGTAYGRLRPDWSLYQWEALCSVDMKTGNILSSIDLQNLVDPRIKYATSSFLLDPIRKELYIKGHDQNLSPVLYRVDKKSFETLEQISAPRELIEDEFISWSVHDRTMFVTIQDYSLEKMRDIYDCYLIDLDSGKVLYHPDSDAIVQALFDDDELYLLDNSQENSQFLVYNYKTGALRTLPMLCTIDSFDLVPNGIFYKTKQENSLYRATRDGALSMKVADSIGTEFKIIGNTVYYLANADTSDYQWYEDQYSQCAVHGWDSVYAIPTCGGAPYLLERRISTSFPMG